MSTEGLKNLRARIRPGAEAAAWVVEEIDRILSGATKKPTKKDARVEQLQDEVRRLKSMNEWLMHCIEQSPVLASGIAAVAAESMGRPKPKDYDERIAAADVSLRWFDALVKEREVIDLLKKPGVLTLIKALSEPQTWIGTGTRGGITPDDDERKALKDIVSVLKEE